MYVKAWGAPLQKISENAHSNKSERSPCVVVSHLLQKLERTGLILIKLRHLLEVTLVHRGVALVREAVRAILVRDVDDCRVNLQRYVSVTKNAEADHIPQCTQVQ